MGREIYIRGVCPDFGAVLFVQGFTPFWGCFLLTIFLMP